VDPAAPPRNRYSATARADASLSVGLDEEQRSGESPASHGLDSAGRASAFPRGCRTNHSECRCINWSRDNTGPIRRGRAIYGTPTSFEGQLPLISPTTDRTRGSWLFTRQPPAEAGASRGLTVCWRTPAARPSRGLSGARAEVLAYGAEQAHASVRWDVLVQPEEVRRVVCALELDQPLVLPVAVGLADPLGPLVAQEVT
jgi:hypothetical protein